MTTTLERAARAVQIEIERQVSEPGYLGWGVGHEDRRPPLTKTYVDGDLDVSALARAVLMAVRGEAPTKAMAESQATDDEGEFAPMLDLIDFSGENKTRTVLRQAWIDGIDAILNEKDTNND